MSAAPHIHAYRLEGDHIVPTGHSRGPWFDDQQHGGAVVGLMARCLEQVPSAQPMRFTRLTVDLSRPVPMVPMRVVARPLRDGRRVQSLEAVISIGDEPVSRAVATRIRVEPGLVPDDKVAPLYPEDVAPAFVDAGSGFPRVGADSFHQLLEVRADRDADGLKSSGWFRMAHPLVADEEPTPLVRLASVADFVSSSSKRLGPDWISINPEVSVQIEREPTGEWIAIETTVRLGNDGVGVSEAVVFDRSGRVGRTSKSVLNMRR